MRQLRLEDLVLAGWNALGVPLIALSALRPVVELGNEPHLLAGVIQLIAVLGAIAAIATRPTGSQPGALPVPTIAAPRILADPEHSGFWTLRFVVYVVSAVLGIGWLTAVTA